MKNFKKVIFALMVVFLVVGFIGCKTESDPPKAPVVTNNFNGKTFIGMEGEGEDAEFVSYIIFTSDKDCEVMFFDEEPMPATYTVADDVATLIGTGEYAALQLSTTKLTDGKFSITIPTAVSGEEEDIVVSYAVGTLWTILYEDSEEDFSLKMPEEELEYYVQQFGLVDGDYTKDDATKTITLTASGWEKLYGSEDEEGWTVVDSEGNTLMTFESLEAAQAYAEENGLTSDDYTVDEKTHTITLMGGGSGEEGGEVTGETWTVLDPEGNEVMTFANLEAAQAYAEEKGLTFGDDFTMNNGTQTITLTDAGWEKVQGSGGSEEEGGEVTGWTVMYSGITLQTFESLEAAETFASKFGLEEKDDYTVNKETQIITLTDDGAEKVGISGDTEGGDSGEVYYYKHNGELCGGQNTLEDFYYEVELYDLVEGTDYTIDYKNGYIDFTDSGYAKLGY